MTEENWLTWRGPVQLLVRLGARLTDRKARLFCCACCRRLAERACDPRWHQAVETAERYADGNASAAELEAARQGVEQMTGEALGDFWMYGARSDERETLAAAALDAASSETNVTGCV